VSSSFVSTSQALGSSTKVVVTGSTSQGDSSAAWITTGSGSSGAFNNPGSASQPAESSNTLTTASSGAGSSGQASSTNPGPVPILQPPSVVSSNSPAPTHRFCPDLCGTHPWCKDFCHTDLTWPPPRECWDYDWCIAWWGFPVPKKDDGDKPKCKLLGCGKYMNASHGNIC
jgi:hypothetical protein